ncbi:MAG: ribose-5-phosphate isomerase RpiA [Pseudomonadota bacterium]
MSQADKKAAAEAAMELIKPGMKVGLGTGSTANELIDLLGPAVADGLDILCVATSKASDERARALGIPMRTLDELPRLDLTIDGADEIGPGLSLIKGGGGAHLREKIVACASSEMVVIADTSKCVEVLGAFPLPLEVVPFGFAATVNAVEQAIDKAGLSGTLTKRQKDGTDFVTDSGNLIIDATLGTIDDPERLAASLADVPGLVEHGLFLGIAKKAFVAGEGGVEVLTP